MRSAETFNKLMHSIGLGFVVLLVLGGAFYIYAWHINTEFGIRPRGEYIQWKIERALARLNQLNQCNLPKIDSSYGQSYNFGAEYIYNVYLANHREIRDVSPLEGLPVLTLVLSETDVTDLSPLSTMPLVCLSLRDTNVHDISPLRGMKLLRLDLSGTGVKDLTPLRGMPLEELILSNTPVEDLSPLEGMNIAVLKIDGTPAEVARQKQEE